MTGNRNFLQTVTYTYAWICASNPRWRHASTVLLPKAIRLAGRVCSGKQRYRCCEGICCLSLQGNSVEAAISYYKILYVSTRQCGVEGQKTISFVTCHLIQWHLPIGVLQSLPISWCIIILYRYLVRFFSRWQCLLLLSTIYIYIYIYIYINVASCWLYFRDILAMHGHMNVNLPILLVFFPSILVCVIGL
jgi:hypothetical protein